MVENLCRLGGKITSGAGSSKDWANIASIIRLYARHLASTGIDQAAPQIADLLEKQNHDLSSEPTIDAVHKRLHEYGSTISREDISDRLHFTEKQYSDAVQSIRSNGYSFQFHSIADGIHNASTRLARQEQMTTRRSATNSDLPNNYKPASYLIDRYHSGDVLHTAVYNPTHSAHLQLVNGHLCGFMKNVAKKIGISEKVKGEICDALTDAGIVAGAAAVTAKIVCGGAVILTISVATEGAAIPIAGPLEEFACSAVAFYTGVSVTAITQAITCALNC
jgi:hypothetical protein